jgi:heme-degrading monooxygenase HmoA
MTMIALLFEVRPYPERVDEYLDLAARLRPALDAMGGCLFIDRFRSRQRPDTLLSFQLWRDEASMAKWRVDAQHHKVQTQGRARIFADYRLRVAQVIREDSTATTWQPQRLSAYNDPTTRAPRHVAIIESRAGTLDGWSGAAESFESIYRPGEFAHVFEPAQPRDAAFERFAGAARLHVCEIERDYGMHERTEAPQFYPPLEKSS